MIIEREIEQTIKIDVKYIEVFAHARYWEDSTVDGVEDTDGKLIPCKYQSIWNPIIEIETGKIINWEIGKTASIHYKVCDCGEYKIQDRYQDNKLSYEGYVPRFMCPKENGYGDYIIMDIYKDGVIKDWAFNADMIEEFEVIL